MILEKVKILNESMVQLEEALKGIEKRSLGKDEFVHSSWSPSSSQFLRSWSQSWRFILVYLWFLMGKQFEGYRC